MADIDNQNNGGSPAGGEPSNQEPLSNKENNNNENSLDKQISDIINQKLFEFQNKIAGTITSLQENAKTLGEQKQKLEIEKLLTESEILDGRFYDFIYSDDMELVKSKAEELENLISQILNERVDLVVNERLGQSSWIPGNNSNYSSVDTFKKPSYML
ncbi:hypothetical protein [Clostridium perfringens]|uniref:hypothetical protein n=1 Tax=Clostridium perfringens TaxID=1502 RepID=UPI003519836C